VIATLAVSGRKSMEKVRPYIKAAPFSLRRQRYAAPVMRFVPLLALYLLAACSGGEASRAPGNMTADEARALNEANEMIDVQRLPEEPAAPAPVKSR
jgi:hypothetical protein